MKTAWTLKIGTGGNLLWGNLQLAKMEMANGAIDGPWLKRSPLAAHGEILDGLQYWKRDDFKAWIIFEMWDAMTEAESKRKYKQ